MVWKTLTSKSRRRLPRVPDRVRIYAVGDIHGRADLLDEILARVDADLAAYPDCIPLHVFLGDYIDRGPASRAVIDRLIERTRTHKTVCLKGNHESYMLDFLGAPGVLSEWQHLGGLETIMSYGIRPSINADSAKQMELSRALNAALPSRHRDFLWSLQLSFSCGDFFFTHAGVKPRVPLNRQKAEDLLWIRDDFLLCEDDHGKVIVHGHSPVSAPEIRQNRINIDTGAYATGRLTCLIIETGGYFVL
jgi:serine/threonine protein phosphatase 1